MALTDSDFLGTLAEADAYFGDRLHETDWFEQTDEKKQKALFAATRAIKRLKFLSTVTVSETLASTPEDVEQACYEEAHSRLMGKDPDREYENLTLSSENCGPSSTSFDTASPGQDHIINGITSWTAWNLLRVHLDNSIHFDIIP